MSKSSLTDDSCCEVVPLLSEPLSSVAAADLSPKLKALADPVRLQLFSAIASHAGGEACVCDISTGVDVSQPTVSHHLKVLRDVGMVEVELLDHDARARVYRLRAERLVALGAWVDQVQAFWSEQLGSFAKQANKRAAKSRR